MRSRTHLLDGRARLRACAELGLEPRIVEWDGQGGTEEAFIIARNLRRRHLSESQRALIGAQLATLQHGRKRAGMRAGAGVVSDEAGDAGLTQEEAGAALSVSPRSIRAARRVVEEGPPELAAAIQQGALTVNAGAALLGRPEQEIAQVVAAVTAGERLPVALRALEGGRTGRPRVAGQIFDAVVLDPGDEGWGRLEEVEELPLGDDGHAWIRLPVDDPGATRGGAMGRAGRLLERWGLTMRQVWVWARTAAEVALPADGAGGGVLPTAELIVYAARGSAELVDAAQHEAVMEGRAMRGGRLPLPFWRQVVAVTEGRRCDLLGAGSAKLDGFVVPGVQTTPAARGLTPNEKRRRDRTRRRLREITLGRERPGPSRTSAANRSDRGPTGTAGRTCGVGLHCRGC